MAIHRSTPLSPMISSLAILSFKKKGKGELGGLSDSIGDVSLEGENLSLSDLSGSMGSLKSLSSLKDKGEDLSDSILSMTSGPKVDDRKFQEIEASVNDLKKHAESTDISSKATKAELESMKKDLSQINDSIKSLLNVYEAVSRQYNPFVDSELPTNLAKEEPEIKLGSLGGSGELNLSTIGDVPFDDDGPLDRIVKPDEEEEIPFESLGTLGSLSLKDLNPSPMEEPVREIEEPLLKPTVKVESSPQPLPTAPLPFDSFALDQFHRLVEYQVNKIYKSRIAGNPVPQAELDNLDRWLNEFKRLGGT